MLCVAFWPKIKQQLPAIISVEELNDLEFKAMDVEEMGKTLESNYSTLQKLQNMVSKLENENDGLKKTINYQSRKLKRNKAKMAQFLRSQFQESFDKNNSFSDATMESRLEFLIMREIVTRIEDIIHPGVSGYELCN